MIKPSDTVISETQRERPTRSRARRIAQANLLKKGFPSSIYGLAKLLTAAAVIKAALGAVACLILIRQDYMWTGGVPLYLHFIGILCFGAGAVFVRKDQKKYLYSAVILACASSAYASLPLNYVGSKIYSLRVEGLAPVFLWLLVMEAPRPLVGIWRKIAMVLTAFCGVAGAWTLAQGVFILLPRAWGPSHIQIWDFGIPLGLVAVLIFAFRSLMAMDDLGIMFAVALSPMLAMLILEAVFPTIRDWAALNRPVIAGFLTAAAVSLPVWMIGASWKESSTETPPAP